MVSAVKSTIALASWRRVTFALNDLSSALRTANRHSRAHALHLERITTAAGGLPIRIAEPDELRPAPKQTVA